MPGPFGPASPTRDIHPPKEHIILTGNRGGSALCQHGTGTLPHARGAIIRRPSGNSPVNHRGYPPRAFPPGLYCFVKTRDVRDATGGSLPPGDIPPTILRRGGNTDQNRTSLVKGGLGECHPKWATCVRMHPRDGRVYPGGDAAEGKGWF